VCGLHGYEVLGWILEPWRLVGLLASWLVGLDWIGFEWLLDKRDWWDWRPCPYTPDAQRGRWICSLAVLILLALFPSPLN